MGVFYPSHRKAPRPEGGAGGEAKKCWGSGKAATANAPISAQDILQRTAEWINSGRYVPPSAVSNVMRDALLAAGLVTEATLRARQIY